MAKIQKINMKIVNEFIGVNLANFFLPGYSYSDMKQECWVIAVSLLNKMGYEIDETNSTEMPEIKQGQDIRNLLFIHLRNRIRTLIRDKGEKVSVVFDADLIGQSYYWLEEKIDDTLLVPAYLRSTYLRALEKVTVNPILMGELVEWLKEKRAQERAGV